MRSTIPRRSYRYTSISGIPASDYTGRLEVKPNGAGSSVEWGAQYLPKGQGDVVVKTIVSTLFKTGLESLQVALLGGEMFEAELDRICQTTDGEIAVINLESARGDRGIAFLQIRCGKGSPRPSSNTSS